MTALARTETTVRSMIRVAGVVQGVGFRPFVHRLATELHLAGHVGNDSSGVFIEVEGVAADMAAFETRLVADAPPLARIFRMDTAPIEVRHQHGFTIVESRPDLAARTFVAPDVAVCDDCVAELFDPTDRRARYPFINCTNCGPRFTITQRLPYDRPNTTMRGFTLCAACSAEYHDPTDRRFHAQPVACADCGPRIWFEDGTAAAGAAVHGTDAAVAATQVGTYTWSAVYSGDDQNDGADDEGWDDPDEKTKLFSKDGAQAAVVVALRQRAGAPSAPAPRHALRPPPPQMADEDDDAPERPSILPEARTSGGAS